MGSALHQRHVGWDRGHEPVIVVAPGDTVDMDVVEASGGQLDPASGPDDVLALDFDLANPLTGPVYVDGAEPGDALRITIDEVSPTVGWGWTALIPGFGLLADEFPDAAIQHWNYGGADTAVLEGTVRIPLRPFVGTIGVALAEPGCHSIIPPRRVGGNMDVRDLCAGTTLWLPVEVPGALFSLGDTHAAQGDGEVCGTAIESPMSVRVRLELERGAAPAAPVYETGAPSRGPEASNGALVTTGIGTDLMECSRDAVRAMIDLVVRRTGLSAELAYMVCSVGADLRISEVVDAPNWVVSCALSKGLLIA